MTANRSKQPPTDDELSAAWQRLRGGASSPQAAGPLSADAVVPQPPPEPADIAAVLNGTLSEDDMVRDLDRALLRGAADDVAMLYALRSAAHDTLQSGSKATPAGERRADQRTPGASGKAGADTRPTNRWWIMPLAAALVLAVGIPVWNSRNSTADNEAAETRGAASSVPLPVSPAEGAPVTLDTLRLVWRPVPLAASYMAEVMDADGQRVVSVATADTTALVTIANASDRLRVAGWWVTARMADGQTTRSDLRSLNANR
jgi:hypothetical protein